MAKGLFSFKGSTKRLRQTGDGSNYIILDMNHHIISDTNLRKSNSRNKKDIRLTKSTLWQKEQKSLLDSLTTSVWIMLLINKLRCMAGI